MVAFEGSVSGNVVLENDSDPEGDTLTISANTAPQNGSLTLNADGSFVYTPNLGFSGADAFTYTITDGNGNEDTATVQFTVSTAENNPPVAIDDSATTSFETSVNGNVLANDSDPDGDAITVVSNTDASNGTVVVNADGSYVYTPDAGFSGADSFEYTISDGEWWPRHCNGQHKCGGVSATATATATTAKSGA